MTSILLLSFLNLIISSKSDLCPFNNLINQLNRQDNSIGDIGVLKIAPMIDPLIISDYVEFILRCLTDKNPVIIPDDPSSFQSTFNELRFRKLSLIFVIADMRDFVRSN
jgi:hypothetical protein